MKFFTLALPLLFTATSLAAPSPPTGNEIVAREHDAIIHPVIGTTNNNHNIGKPVEHVQHAHKSGVVLQISGSLIENILRILKNLLDSLTEGLTGSNASEDDSVQILNQLTGALGQLQSGITSRDQAVGGVLGVVDQLVSAVAVKLPEAKAASTKLHEAIAELHAIATKKAVAADKSA